MLLKSTLLYLSKKPGLQRWSMKFKVSRNMAHRFIAGDTPEQALQAVLELNRRGYSASFDFLGESVTTREEAQAAAGEYLRNLQRIKEAGADSNVSLKLTQFGLAIDEKFCEDNVERVVAKAKELNNFVRIDMEDSSVTEKTLNIFKSLRSRYDNVGIVIQAMLYRAENDIRDLMKIGARVRLCKGAYLEPKTVAFPKKSDVDKNYIKLTDILLHSGIYHGIATHDPKMIEAAKETARRDTIGKDKFEFQMLYGIRRDLQEQLIQDGYRMRLYVPYGDAWYPYFMRRLAERPANVLFILRSLVHG